jgi:uncharacterized protein YndB with AHSA1/START domain
VAKADFLLKAIEAGQLDWRRIMKWFLGIVVLLAGVLLLIVLIGALLPKEHVATREGRYHQPPDAIWKAITDIDAMPSWRVGLKSVKRLPDVNGLPAWVETLNNGVIPLEATASEPPGKLVVRIADPKLPFGGTWTYEIHATPEGSTLRITENGEVYNTVFRFVLRFFLGYTATIDGYLTSLAKKFGEPPRIGD